MNRREILEKTLWYVYETSTAAERDLWIWDNASTDDTPDFLGTMKQWLGVRVFRSKIDLGVVGSRKRLLPLIKTPYIFTLDDDTWMVNKGWAGAVVRALEGDLSIGQLGVPQGYIHDSSDYGIAHTKLDRPFFRVPPIQPQGPIAIDGSRVLGYLDEHPELYGPSPSRNSSAITSGGELLVVPARGSQLPFAVTGGASAWRTAEVLSLTEVERSEHVDLREAWGFPLQGRGLREAVIMGYGFFHPSPGPLWHLGRCETYWGERCRIAPTIYGRSGEIQRVWLEAARRASGWGSPLEHLDVQPHQLQAQEKTMQRPDVVSGFNVADGLILFSDDRPGAHASLFGPDGKLEFRPEASYFHDADRAYVWAFAYAGSFKKGALFVFATSDREVVGEVGVGGAIVPSKKKAKIVREDGKPVGLAKRSR